nr:unnamed protein product [Spirometra erinaceieuropaei]
MSGFLIAAPSLPSNIRATQISADEVRITWDPPMSSRAGAGDDEMIVESFNGGVLQETAKKPISEGVHTVNEIPPNTVMSFTVQVVSPGPLGGFSEIKQLPDLITWPAPMAAPKGLKLTATGENSLHASWTENEDKALLLKYEIRVTAADTKKTEIHYTDSTSISINNLDTFTEYTVEVAAVGKPNQNGEGSVAGPNSAATVRTWPGLGGIPSDFSASATDTSILLSWEQPQGRPTGIVDYYEVTVKDKTGNEPDKVVQAYAQTFTVQNLKPLTMYTVEVRTKNKPAEGTENGGGGLGDPAILDVETWPGGSFEPTNGKVELLPPSAIKVSWSPPQGLIGSVEEYRVLLKKGDVLVRSESAPRTTMSLALTELETGVKYKVYIQAKIAPNSQGKGGRLGPEVFITETSLTESAPSAPQNLVVKVTSNSMDVSWSPPASPNGILGAYNVSINIGKTDSQQVDGLNASFADLKPLTTYKVTVRAQTGAGYGPAASIIVTTDPDVGGIPVELNASATDTSISLSWEKPQGRPTGIVDYYEVRVKDKTGNEPDNVDKAFAQTFTVQNLKPLTMYTVEVRTKNKPAEGTENGGGGLGDPADLEVETWPGGSLVPTNGKVEVLSPSAIKVSWSQPQGLIGSVEEYHVLLKKGDFLARSESAPGTTMSLTLTELETGVKYKVYIQAKIAPNSQGKGGRLGPEVFIAETALNESGGGGDVQLTGGLSGGAIAGIVIGVLLAFILLLLLVLVLMRRRNQNVMIEDFQWSEGTGASYFMEDMAMSQLGR